MSYSAASAGDYRSALMLLLDWRPMSQTVDARHDMLAFADLALEAVENVDEPVLRAEGFREVAALSARSGQRAQARQYFDQAATIFEQIGSIPGAASRRSKQKNDL